jgi:hypothetical protein
MDFGDGKESGELPEEALRGGKAPAKAKSAVQ